MDQRQQQIISDLFSILCIDALPPMRLLRVLIALGYSTGEALAAIEMVYKLGFLRATRDNGSMPVGLEKTEGAIEKYYLTYQDDWFHAQRTAVYATWERLEHAGAVVLERTGDGRILADFAVLKG